MLADRITVPIAASFPIVQIRDAVTVQTGRYVHGKIVSGSNHIGSSRGRTHRSHTGHGRCSGECRTASAATGARAG
jgi:hypothetical protein